MKSSDSQSKHTTEAKEYGGGASFSYGLWGAGSEVSGSDEKDRFNTQAKNEGISFNLSTVSLNRPWMDTTFFKIKGWRANI